MQLAKIRDYLLSRQGSVELTPFGPDVLVYKVGNKMFALVGWKNHPLTLNLKCDPEHAIELRERYAAIEPGYHMNKQLWNTLTLDGSIPTDEVLSQVDDSYDLIVASLTKKARAELEAS